MEPSVQCSDKKKDVKTKKTKLPFANGHGVGAGGGRRRRRAGRTVDEADDAARLDVELGVGVARHAGHRHGLLDVGERFAQVGALDRHVGAALPRTHARLEAAHLFQQQQQQQKQQERTSSFQIRFFDFQGSFEFRLVIEAH